MKKLFLAMIAITFACFSTNAQDKKALKFAKSISADDLKSYLSVLASDSLEGRETGKPGQKKAAAYISSKFESFGLTPPVETEEGNSYFQTYPLRKSIYRTSYLKKGDDKKDNTVDFLYYSRAETRGEENIEIVFFGDSALATAKRKDIAGKYVAISNTAMQGWRQSLEKATRMGAAGFILFIEDVSQYDFVLQRFGRSMKQPKLTVGKQDAGSKIIFGDTKLASWLFGQPYNELKENGIGSATKAIFMSDILHEEISAENVLGFIKGTEKPDEVVVITAHYDHIGISEDGEINNGADDDGSGTSSVLEIAQAFSLAAQKGKGPKRSMLFMAVSGEEKGLLGSSYYTSNPVFPLENTVVDLNIDMVGRVDENHSENPDYVYLIGSDKLSKDLHDLSEKVNTTYSQLELDYTYNDENDPNRFYYRSDHYNFAKNNVPIIFYFNGTHADYHRPTDTIEKINFEVMEKRAKLVFFTAWEIANREERIHLD